MSEEFKVRVVEFSDRKCYQLQWTDPMTGRKKTKSSGVERTGKKRERDAATKAAGDLETKLRSGQQAHSLKVTWSQFRERYESEVLPRLAERTGGKIAVIFNAIEELVSPKNLRDLTAERLSYFQAELRRGGRAEATIKSMLAHLQAALRWAKRLKLLQEAPTIDMPERAGSKMKGRPITTEEFERMLEAVERVLIDGRAGIDSARRKKPECDKAEARRREVYEEAAKAAAPVWRYYLRGLWLSGLRLSESLELYWDRDDKLCIDLTGKRPMLRIPAALEKGNKDRHLPLSPEFAEFLLQTPAEERTGQVFKLASRKMKGARLAAEYVGRIISQIGERAQVKVGAKCASAHDLRRSFGERWSSRVMPQVLQELMRHESIDTTLKFYVGQNAQRTADVLWLAHDAANAAAESNRNGNKPQNEAAPSPTENEA